MAVGGRQGHRPGDRGRSRTSLLKWCISLSSVELTDAAKQILAGVSARKVVRAFGEYLVSAQGPPKDFYTGAIKYAKEKTGVKGKELFMPIRAALTGVVHGPELDRVFAVLGKESAVKRLQRFNN